MQRGDGKGKNKGGEVSRRDAVPYEPIAKDKEHRAMCRTVEEFEKVRALLSSAFFCVFCLFAHWGTRR